MAKKPAKGRGKSADTATPKDIETTDIVPAAETAPDIQRDDAPVIEDAEVVSDDAPADDEPLITPPPPAEDATEEADAAEGDLSAEDEIALDEPATEEASSEPEPEETTEPEPPAADPEPEVRHDEPAAAVPAATRSGGTGFFALLLGGIAAGAIGYAVAYFQTGAATGPDPEITETMNQFNDSLLALEERVTEIPAEFNAAPLTEALSGIEDTQNALSEQVVSLGERLDQLERQPNADGTLGETAVAAFEQDMQALRDQVGTLQSDLQAMTEQAMEQLSVTRDEAQAIEDNAVAAAQAATRRAALARIQAALETGAPFAPALTDLEAALEGPPPEALVAVAEEGVATLASLQDEFTPLARQALSTARSEGVAGEESRGFSAFLRNQFDVRSVAPQEGGSVDAILSRAEAALNDGRLNDTLAELASLPEPVRASLTDWTARAEARVSAVDAATTLSMQSEG